MTRIGRIVEVEAYIDPHDLASHSSTGMTNRTRVMFGASGHAYIYLIYGIHHCMNVVTEAQGTAAAVLLCALEPIAGTDKRASGPGLLCKAMGIDLTSDALDLPGETLYLAAAEAAPAIEIVARPRIGVDYAGEWASKLLRFYIRGNPFVSKK